MTLEEVYAKIVQHQIKGLMIHEQLAEYYDFLGLKGYKRCHEYHYFDENCTYRSTVRYFINHHNKLIPEMPVENPNVIPSSWYKYTRQDVDASTKKNAVKNGVDTWVEWETETRNLYEEMYQELIELGEIASSIKVRELICLVDCELKKAMRHQLTLKAVDYDITYIIDSQSKLHNKYKKKQKRIGVRVC